MLPKINRLKKKKDFDQVFKKGKDFKEGFLVFKIAKNKLKYSRFGFVIGKNISKRATVRNKIRRRLRDLMRAKIKKIKDGVDGIFIARPGIEAKDFWEIEEAMNKFFEKSGILKEN